MPKLVVNLPDDLVKALKRRAAQHGRSAEQEHRAILRAALRALPRRSLAEALARVPDVGRDEDFERLSGRSPPPMFFRRLGRVATLSPF